MKSRGRAILETVIEPETDGLAAWFLRAVPGTTMQTPAPEQGGGQYAIVAGGTMFCNGVELPRLSCAYVSSAAGPLALQAGADGLEVLILQFPRTEASSSSRVGV